MLTAHNSFDDEPVPPECRATIARIQSVLDGTPPGAGEALDTDPHLANHYRLDAVRAHLLEKTGDHEAAIQHYRIAAARTTSIPERNYLMTQAARLTAN
jgi:predicted RNA polymerase sigma factor